MDNLDELNNMFNMLVEDTESKNIDVKIDLGRKLILRVVSPVNCIHIKKYFLHKDTQEWTPGLPGVCMKIPEFLEFMKLLPKINDTIQLENIQSCCKKEDQHMCTFCIPEGLYTTRPVADKRNSVARNGTSSD